MPCPMTTEYSLRFKRQGTGCAILPGYLRVDRKELRGVLQDRPIFYTSVVQCSTVLRTPKDISQGFDAVVVRVTKLGGVQLNCHLKDSAQWLNICCLTWIGQPFPAHIVPLIGVRHPPRSRISLTGSESYFDFFGYFHTPIFMVLLKTFGNLKL